jgi:hypothetical protein
VRAAAAEIGWKPRLAEQLSEDETERLRHRYVSGDSIHAIARDLGIHHQQVPAALRTRGWLDNCAKERARRQRESRALASRRGPASKRGRRTARDEWWRPPRESRESDAPPRHAYGIAQRANELWREGLTAERIAEQVGVSRPYLKWLVELYRRIDPTWFAQRADGRSGRRAGRGARGEGPVS